MTDLREAAQALYVASRASLPSRPAMWRELRAQGWPIVSTWIDEAGAGETDSFVELWDRITGEIRSADGLVIYAEAEDFPLKGALIEVGIALGMGKPVAAVFPGVSLEPRSMRPAGFWVMHPLVERCETVADARRSIALRTALAEDTVRMVPNIGLVSPSGQPIASSASAAEDTVEVPRELTSWLRSAIIEANAEHDRQYSTDGVLRSDRIWNSIIAALPARPQEGKG